jgi:hypothetical protein
MSARVQLGLRSMLPIRRLGVENTLFDCSMENSQRYK